MNDQNILLNNGDVAGIIDFDDNVYSYRVVDIATGLGYMTLMSDTNTLMENAKNMYRGYNSVLQLNETELKVLYKTMLVRYAQSLAISEYKYLYVDPGNEYLLLTQRNGWKCLNKLLSFGDEQFLKNITI